MEDSVFSTGGRAAVHLVRRYAVAVGCTGLAVWGRSLLDPWLDNQCEFSLFYLSVIATAWTAGLGPAIFAIVVGAFAAAHFFIEPASSLYIEQIPDLVQLVIFCIVNAIAIFLFDRLQRQRHLAEQRSAENCELSESLKLADERKDEFLALLAHELRNPLSPILSSLALIKRKRNDSVETDRLIDIIGRQSGHLVRLTDDLLDVSRFCRGKVTLQREVLDVRVAIADAMEMTETMVVEKRHHLHTVLPNTPIWVDADRVRLAQLIANLVGNAAKYTPPSGRIAIDVETNETLVTIAVRDNGIGFSPEEAEKITMPFAQVDGSRTREYGGLGLGLTIVSRLVALHGGSFETFSKGPGRGSTFTVQLPLAATQSILLQVDNLPPPKVAAGNNDGSFAVSIQLLIVEDNEDASGLLRELFESEGIEVQTAKNGMQALQLANTFNFDVMLLDIGLPGMDGYEVAKRIRSDETHNNSKLIAVTGWGNPADRVLAQEAGFDLHLVKPVVFSELLRQVRDVCGCYPCGQAAKSRIEVVSR